MSITRMDNFSNLTVFTKLKIFSMKLKLTEKDMRKYLSNLKKKQNIG